MLILQEKMKLICFLLLFLPDYKKQRIFLSVETKLAKTQSEVWRHRIYEYGCVKKYITCLARFFIYERECVVCVTGDASHAHVFEFQFGMKCLMGAVAMMAVIAFTAIVVAAFESLIGQH